jgi:hypothetical protein
MAEWTTDELERYVEDRLDAVGLTGAAFVLTDIVADLRVRLSLDGELDELIGPADLETDSDEPAPVDDDRPFDPLRP